MFALTRVPSLAMAFAMTATLATGGELSDNPHPQRLPAVQYAENMEQYAENMERYTENMERYAENTERYASNLDGPAEAESFPATAVIHSLDVPPLETESGGEVVAAETTSAGFGECPTCEDHSIYDAMKRLCRRHKECRPCYKSRPFGTFARAAMATQIRNGKADQMVLYGFDFREDDHVAQLSLRGQAQLAKFAMMAEEYGLRIVIESVPNNPQLDEARRQNVVAALRQMGESAADDWILVGTPNTAGLRGVEAVRIDQNNLRQTEAGAVLNGGSDQGGAIPLPF